MNSIQMLAHIFKGLGPLGEKVVFVGGSTVPFYLTDPGAMTARPTEDVDCVVEVLTRGQYYTVEAELERLGFRHSTEADAPICRWKYQGLTVDIMPTEGLVLGFTNAWYPDGCANSAVAELPDAGRIRIFNLARYSWP